MSVHLAASLRLVDDDHKHDHRALVELAGLPDGSKVILNVGNRIDWSLYAVTHLRTHADRLVMQVEGSPRAAAAWFQAITEER